MAITIIGKVGITPQGEWSASRADYNRLDWVTYQGSSYMAIWKTGNVPVGTPLSNKTYWEKTAVGVDLTGLPLKGTFDSVALALAGVPLASRKLGDTIGVREIDGVVEYWWKKGVANSDLIRKDSTTDQTVISSQLYNYETNILDYAISGTPGVISSFPTAQLSNKIAVEGDEDYFLSWLGAYDSTRTYIFSDINNVLISSSGWTNNTSKKSPVGAVYFQFTAKRLDSAESTLDTTIKFNKGTERGVDGAIFESLNNGIDGRGLMAERLKDKAEIKEVGETGFSVLNKQYYDDSIEIELVDGVNGQLYNHTLNTPDKAISGTPGVVGAFPTAQLSVVIPVIGDSDYFLSWLGSYSSTRTYIFSNEEGGFLSSGGWSNNTTKRSPVGAAYFQFTAKRTEPAETVLDESIKFNQGYARAEGDAVFSATKVLKTVNGFPLPSSTGGELVSEFKTTDKTVFVFGDSSTANKEGSTGSVDNNILGAWPLVAKNILSWGDTRNTAKWAASILDRTETTYKTNVLSYTEGSTDNTLSNQVYSLLRKKSEDPTYKPDVIVLLAGGNDLPSVYPYTEWDTLLGVFDTIIYDAANYATADYGLLDMAIPADLTRYNSLRNRRKTIYGAMRWIIETCLTNFPNTTFMVCGTLQRGSSDGKNKNIFQFTDALKKVANYYGCPYIDSTRESGMTYFSETRRLRGWDTNYYTIEDNTHKNVVGNALIGTFIAKEIEHKYFEKPAITAVLA